MRIRGKGNGEESVTRRDDLGGLSSGRSGIHAEEQERSVRERDRKVSENFKRLSFALLWVPFIYYQIYGFFSQWIFWFGLGLISSVLN